MRAQRVLAITARAYGYRGREIADYLRKDPASVSGYLRGEDLISDVKKTMQLLDTGRKNVNSKV